MPAHKKSKIFRLVKTERGLMKPITVFLIFFFLTISFRTHADLVSIYWEGVISSITSWGEDSVPTGVGEGSKITGSLSYESTQSSGHRSISGDIWGDEFSFPTDALVLSMSIGTHKWRIQGGRLDFYSFRDPNWQAFDVFCKSDNSNYDVFPNLVGYYEAGFALIDTVIPHELYDGHPFAIQSELLNLEHIDLMSGNLSARRWDQGNIVEGYYIDYDISRVSYSPIPEPASALLLIGGMATIFILRKTGQPELSD